MEKCTYLLSSTYTCIFMDNVKAEYSEIQTNRLSF